MGGARRVTRDGAERTGRKFEDTDSLCAFGQGSKPCERCMYAEKERADRHRWKRKNRLLPEETNRLTA